ncbi:MAG: hypothetical protein M1837_003236 [Sclerophora amabilis]|nr:MAG: hypothetical protein M1837_003236 [Sclerophora amabilis]
MQLYLSALLALSVVAPLAHSEEVKDYDPAYSAPRPMMRGEKAVDWHKPPSPVDEKAYRDGQCWVLNKGEPYVEANSTQACCHTDNHQPNGARYYPDGGDMNRKNDYPEHCAMNKVSRDSLNVADFARCCGANHEVEYCCAHPLHRMTMKSERGCQAPDPADKERHMPGEWEECENPDGNVRGAFFWGKDGKQALLVSAKPNVWEYTINPHQYAEGMAAPPP